jgi:hypothetical protein
MQLLDRLKERYRTITWNQSMLADADAEYENSNEFIADYERMFAERWPLIEANYLLSMTRNNARRIREAAERGPVYLCDN